MAAPEASVGRADIPFIVESPDGSIERVVVHATTAMTDAGPFSSVAPPVTVTLTVDLAGTGTGTVTSTPSGLGNCTGTALTCVGTFESGTAVTLNAAAASGYEFLGWSGACAGTSACTLTLTSARYVAAEFRVLIPPVVTRYYHLDTLGSVRAVTKENGTTARLDDYHAFGEAGTPPMGDSIRFTGKERDAETALDYFGARYYRNLMGRFISVDPLEINPLSLVNPQRMNRYAYALNNPLTYKDPDGRDAILVNFSAGGVIKGFSLGHSGIISVHRDGSGTFVDFGPDRQNVATSPGTPKSKELTNITFGPDGLPTQESFKKIAEALAYNGVNPMSIRLAYFKTSDAETAKLDAWLKNTLGKEQTYNVFTNNCEHYCRVGLEIAGVRITRRRLAIPNIDYRILALFADREYQMKASVSDSWSWRFPKK